MAADKLRELQSKRLKLANQLREHGKNEKNWKAEDKQTWIRINADYDATLAEIKTENEAIKTSSDAIAAKLAALDADETGDEGESEGEGGSEGGGEPVPGLDNTHLRRRNLAGGNGANTPCTDAHRALALQGWMRNQMDQDIDERHIQAAKLSGINLGRKQLTFNMSNTEGFRARQNAFVSVHPTRRKELMRQNAAMSGSSVLTGGNVVPPETLLRSLEINMLAYGGVEQVSDVIVTSTGERMSWPTFDDTGNVGRRIGESTNLDNSGAGGALPTGNKIFWDAYKYTSDAVLIPFELLQDAFIDLPGVIGEMLGERLGRKKNRDYTYGTGDNGPKGIVTCAALGRTTAAAASITYDDIIYLEHSIDPAYRVDCGYMAHDNVILALRLLKDSQGLPIWQAGWNAGRPDTLNGWSLTTNQDMDSTIASTKKTVLYGQFKKYKIRRVGAMRIYRLEERYRDNDQDGFVALIREDGNLLNSGTVPVKYIQQAA